MKPTMTYQNTRTIPWPVVCSTKFGRYPKISREQAWNMFISDEFAVPYAGHKKVLGISDTANGRGLYSCQRGDFMLLVIDEEVYRIDRYLNFNYVAALNTTEGDLFIAENDAKQIGICDKLHIYIYDYSAGTFNIAPIDPATDFVPASLSFQNGYFIAAEKGIAKWRLSALNNGMSWPANPENVGLLQAPDSVVHCVPMPNILGQLFVFGQNVIHCFNDVGTALFPYARNNSFAIDYGTANPATIASGDNFIIWLASNNKAGLSIMYSSGGPPQQISTDGINLVLASLNNPSRSYGFLVKLDGHVFYQLTFTDPKDNFSIAYDFNNQKFLYVSDENQNYHEAKQIVNFNNKYYFVSFNDGNLYEMSSEYVTYDGKEIPRILITAPFRLPDTTPWIVQSANITIEQGNKPTNNYQEPLVDKGNINVATDFPLLGEATVGDLYHVKTPIQDNDPAHTNTKEYFNICDIVWNGTTYDVVRDMRPRVDLSLSRDGGATFGCNVPRVMNKTAHRKNMLNYFGLGRCNELTAQFRFYGFDRFVVANGELNIYQ